MVKSHVVTEGRSKTPSPGLWWHQRLQTFLWSVIMWPKLYTLFDHVTADQLCGGCTHLENSEKASKWPLSYCKIICLTIVCKAKTEHKRCFLVLCKTTQNVGLFECFDRFTVTFLPWFCGAAVERRMCRLKLIDCVAVCDTSLTVSGGGST